ncbi:MAG TPA: hypothetical protein VJ246_03105, partial [Patescibacteria group bacterium]|nr:hypothetical protein [Patescibacteria group bacterium]
MSKTMKKPKKTPKKKRVTMQKSARKRKSLSKSKSTRTIKKKSAHRHTSNINLSSWPLLYKDILKVKNPRHHVAVCCLWTERQVVETLLKNVDYNTIGNLYSAQGINAMIRNIFANPHIRVIVLWGAEMSLSGHSLLMLKQKGVDATNRKIVAARGEIERELPDSVVEE